jgi:hypothetical protein
MATLRHRIARVFRTRDASPHVHFHQGPQGSPMPCYDTRCSSPRLDVVE